MVTFLVNCKSDVIGLCMVRTVSDWCSSYCTTYLFTVWPFIFTTQPGEKSFHNFIMLGHDKICSKAMGESNVATSYLPLSSGPDYMPPVQRYDNRFVMNRLFWLIKFILSTLFISFLCFQQIPVLLCAESIIWDTQYLHSHQKEAGHWLAWRLALIRNKLQMTCLSLSFSWCGLLTKIKKTIKDQIDNWESVFFSSLLVPYSLGTKVIH